MPLDSPQLGMSPGPSSVAPSMTIMRALDACHLDDDIVDLIMTFCPKFFVLRLLLYQVVGSNAPRTVTEALPFFEATGTTYNVLQSHPKCISHAVACNIVSIVGELLPEALRVVRYPYGDYDRSLDPETMAVTCPEEDIVGVITAKELAKLQGNAEVIDALEDIYSVTCVKFTICLSDSHGEATATTAVTLWTIDARRMSVFEFVAKVGELLYTDDDLCGISITKILFVFGVLSNLIGVRGNRLLFTTAIPSFSSYSSLVECNISHGLETDVVLDLDWAAHVRESHRFWLSPRHVLTRDAGLVNPIDTGTAGIWLNQFPDLSRLSGLTHGWNAVLAMHYSNANHQLRQLKLPFPRIHTCEQHFCVLFSASLCHVEIILAIIFNGSSIHLSEKTWEFVDAPPTTMTPSSFSWHICVMSVFTGLNA
ncbi:hypothetical protein B0H13DRAFT_1878536 [Mycena leptocephala]|nr:hypothetical protein B0H13DRAFT_1878536 [Mycena leptocephala]